MTTETTTATKKSISAILGEIVWLMSQSPIHKRLSIADLEWLVMPPILLNQFKIYHDDTQPIGVVFWGCLNEEAEERLKTKGRIEPEDWGNGASISADQGMVANSGGNLWVVELIAPFNTEQNRHQDFIINNLIATNFNGVSFNYLRLNPITKKSEAITVEVNSDA
jgi:cytolysin-activating lysine-acyltransferase